MSITISPLDLLLDDENPRFVVLSSREQADIRKYLVTYEDVCTLAVGINNYGGILLGERVVALKRGENYVVIEGNRRTCALQLLLNPALIPDGFRHRIPVTSDRLIETCQTIEVDLVPTREAALELMTKRHIEGVKQWKPLAKKQFSASNYAAGRTVSNLSLITGMKESEIKADIRDYKFFLAAYTTYCACHLDYHGQIVDLKIDPFLRLFKASFTFNGAKVKPVNILKISYTDSHDTVSGLPADIFMGIVQRAFEETAITEQINTRNTLKDVSGVIAALNTVIQAETVNENRGANSQENNNTHRASAGNNSGGATSQSSTNPETSSNRSTGGASTEANTSSGNNSSSGFSSSGVASGGPPPGGPAPRTFFETLSWDQKLLPDNSEHQGLLAAVHELYSLSITSFGRKKAYEVFPVATGMVLRTAYEQVLILRLKQTNLWGNFMQTVRRGSFPTLAGMETFIDNPANKPTILPTDELRSAISSILTYGHREFLNANIHNPGAIHVSADSLSGIAQGGMFTLIQGSIKLL